VVVVEDLAGTEDLDVVEEARADNENLEADASGEIVEGHVTYGVVAVACAAVAGDGKRMDLVGGMTEVVVVPGLSFGPLLPPGSSSSCPSPEDHLERC
jgi:hypothetical protein